MSTANKKKIDEIINSSPELKCLPFVSVQALSLINNPKTTIRELSDLASTDATLTAKILEVVNSPEFSLQYEVNDVAQAIHYMGFEKIKDFLFNFCTEKLKKNSILKNMFKQNLLIANLARQACEKLDDFKTADDAYVAGLLQGVGRLFLLENFPVDYMHMFNFKADKLMEKERETFRYTYPQLSSELIRSWGLSGVLAQSVEKCHLRPDEKSSILEIVLFYATGLGDFNKKDGVAPRFLGEANQNKDVLKKLGLKPIGLKKTFSQGYAVYEDLLLTYGFDS